MQVLQDKIKHAHRRFIAALPLFFVWAAVHPAPVSANRSHEVRSGQTLSLIAKRYGVSPSSLASANQLSTLTVLKSGQLLTIPARREVYVAPGQTLAGLAKRLGTTPEVLARTNHIKPTANLKVGQRLVLPGASGQSASEAASPASLKPVGRAFAKGPVLFYRPTTRERVRVTLVDPRKNPRMAARKALAKLLRPRDSRKTKLPHPRLIRILSQVTAHFGNRPIYVISGYREARGNTHRTSKHTMGRAIDFRIPGVSNAKLRDYCRRFPDAGVGYYPHSTFVHLDVRSARAYWVDLSGPGEAPRYRRFEPWMDRATPHKWVQSSSAPQQESEPNEVEELREELSRDTSDDMADVGITDIVEEEQPVQSSATGP